MDLENRKLNEVLDYEQPTKYIVETTDYDDSFETPVLTAGKSFLLGYTDETDGVFTNVPAIIFDDFTTSFHYVDFPFKVKSSAMKILTPKKEYVDLKYVYLQMKKVRIDTQLHKRYWISKFSIKEIAFPKIDLQNGNSKTQQRIAEILDNAAALRDKTAQLLTEYDLLAQSIFLEMFGDPVLNPKGWEKTELVKLCPLVKNSVSPEEIKDNTNYVGLDSIEKHSGEIHTIQTVKENELKSNKYLFSSEHILYGKLRPYLNKVANPSFNGICSTDIITLLPNQKKTNKAFVTNYLRGKWHVNWANNNTSGANLPRLNLTQFSRLKIMNPPIKLQNQFADKIALIEQQKALAKQELQEAEDLFNCLLQKAFKGELG